MHLFVYCDLAIQIIHLFNLCSFFQSKLQSSSSLVCSTVVHGIATKDILLNMYLTQLSLSLWFFLMALSIMFYDRFEDKDKGIPVQRVSARDQIQHLTAQAWVSENKQLEQKCCTLKLAGMDYCGTTR
ncbi:hypothetical protein P8452_47047 [Trifolium repens]|nr:hypothetical protein P8452_47047 [Trifolium repens]